MAHITEAIVVTCIDFRFQKYITGWLKKNLGDHKYNRVAMAGAIFDFKTILNQIDISNRLHHIKKVFLINHEDCGAYGKLGTYERHQKDLRLAKAKIQKKYPHLEVKTYYLHLKGRFELIKE